MSRLFTPRTMRGLFVAALLVLTGTGSAFADTVTCTATTGFWRWGGNADPNNPGAKLDLHTIPTDFYTSYLDAIRATEDFPDAQAGFDPTNASRGDLDAATMPLRFTTGPQPFGAAYSDKRVVTLSNFVGTTASYPDPLTPWPTSPFTLDTSCVPSDAVISSVTAHVTHGVLDPNLTSAYQAELRVLTGSNNGILTWSEFALSNLATVAGLAGEVQESLNLTGAFSPATTWTAAQINGANIQFRAARTGAALRAIINEISLTVEYTCSSCTPPAGGEDSLVTGGGWITLATSSRKQTNANFGFNARTSSLVDNTTPVAGNGVFQYNDGTYSLHGTVQYVDACASVPPGGTFQFSGSYVASTGTGKKTLSGTFTVWVDDVNEPGKGFDIISLHTTATGGGTGPVNFDTKTLAGGNIQFHFCNGQ